MSLLLLFALAQGALANPPRVSLVEGTVLYEPADEIEVSELAVNLPLATGDRIYSTDRARIEIQQGRGNLVRVAGNTDLKWLGTDEVLRIELTSGDLILKIADPENHKVFTPFASIRIKTPGVYRLSVQPDGAVLLAVREGTAEVANRFRVREISAGEQIEVDQVQSGLTRVSLWDDQDEFDLWSEERDQIFLHVASAQYLDPSNTAGVVELDQYGEWDYVADYGNVWFPSVGVDFAPYRVGRWAHYPRWGWTWISYEPWGWLPYHSGQWVYYRPYSRWCWVPGGSFLWSGALVDFYYGSGYVGWAPRGHRGWGSSRRFGSGFGLSLSTPGFSFVLRTDFGRGRVDHRLRRDAGNRARNFREGLPRDLSERGRGRNVIQVGQNQNGVDRSRMNSGRSSRDAITNRLRQDSRTSERTTVESGLSRWQDRSQSRQPRVVAPQTSTPARSSNSGWATRQRQAGPRVVPQNSTLRPERQQSTTPRVQRSPVPARSSSSVDRSRSGSAPRVIQNRTTGPSRSRPGGSVTRSVPRNSVSPNRSSRPTRSAPARSSSRRPPPQKKPS